MRKNLLWILAAAAIAVGPVSADVWDTASDNDNGTGTDNDLIHGTVQVHDLSVQSGPVADQDWYRASVPARSSFEVVMDGLTGDINVSFDESQLDRLEGTGATIVQNHACVTSACFAKRLAWRNTTTSEELSFVRVSGAGCGTSCTTADQYTIRSRETTIGIARFNNSGSQLTVLLVQNTSDVTVNATYYYWNTSGTLLATSTVAIGAKSLNILSLAGIGALAGQGGSVTIAHDAGYGQLNAKAVALEPSTGFSFDTPGVYRGGS
jgi:hypothetical protein